MNNTETVYQAIKQINAEGKLAEPDILARATALSLKNIDMALRELDKECLIEHSNSVRSTGRDDYDKVIDFGGIRAV